MRISSRGTVILDTLIPIVAAPPPSTGIVQK